MGSGGAPGSYRGLTGIEAIEAVVVGTGVRLLYRKMESYRDSCQS
jgi:hypothetical protein